MSDPFDMEARLAARADADRATKKREAEQRASLADEYNQRLSEADQVWDLIERFYIAAQRQGYPGSREFILHYIVNKRRARSGLRDTKEVTLTGWKVAEWKPGGVQALLLTIDGRVVHLCADYGEEYFIFPSGGVGSKTPRVVRLEEWQTTGLQRIVLDRAAFCDFLAGDTNVRLASKVPDVIADLLFQNRLTL